MRRRQVLRTVGGVGAALAGAGCGLPAADRDAAFYVSPEGDDDWSGRRAEPAGRDGPFRTVARARDAVRERDWSGRNEPVRVLLRGGRYPVASDGSPLAFGAADSGSEDAPVVYAAYPGEEPVLSGGRAIDGWEATTVNGVDAWKATVPAVRDGDWYPRQLFVNGERRPRPRLPEGVGEAFAVRGRSGSSPSDGGFYRLGSGPDDRHVLRAPAVEEWHNPADVELVALRNWQIERLPVASVDGGGLVTVGRRAAPPARWARTDGAAYYVENVFEALSEPGEWYLDRETGELWYVPREGESREEVTAVAPGPGARRVVEVAGSGGRSASHLRFRGLAVRHAAWAYPPTGTTQAAALLSGAVVVADATGCAFEGCTVEHVGEYGVSLGPGATATRVTGCEFADLGAGGVKLDGGRGARATAGNRIADCRVRDGGRVFHQAVGVLAMRTRRTDVVHNEVCGFHYGGISCGWNWCYGPSVSRDNAVERNHVHDVGSPLIRNHHAGIYTLGEQPGTTIRGNVVHAVHERDPTNGGGIHVDQASSHLLIEDNVVHDATVPLNLHFGRENTVRNNVLVGDGAGVVDGGPASTTRHGGCSTLDDDAPALRLRHNVLVADGAPVLDADPATLVSDRNLFWDADADGDVAVAAFAAVDTSGPGSTVSPAEELGLAAWRERTGHDAHSVAADPRVETRSGSSVALAEGSPAFDVGFEPVDASAAGPRGDVPASR